MSTRRFLARPGGAFHLNDHDPGDTGGVRSKKEAADRLADGIERLRALQEKLSAQDRFALLLVFQGMDAAGKDGTIEHVMSGVNPQGCEVSTFKVPSNEELDHDFLWRHARRLPERGRIGIFNRSHYEEVLVVRVHREVLAGEKLPARLVGRHIWQERYESINGFERHLVRNGTVIRKFFLHVSRAEQRRRFAERLKKPRKHWKFSLGDVQESQHWDDYMRAYQEAIAHTTTPEAPWYVIPADHKWFTRMVVAELAVEALEALDLTWPRTDAAKRRELREARRLLEQ